MNEQMKNDIKKFCEPECNRFEFITDWLTREEITFSVIPTGSARHFMIRLDKIRPYLKRFYVKTLVAHYDRVSGSPGANDNSASVIQLLYSINQLKNLKFAHNIQIIFTDKEELTPGEPIVNQGSFQLAHLFREKKINNCIFFVFDMCGIGDTLISGRAGLQLLRLKYDSEIRYKKMYEDMSHFSSTLSEIFLQFREGEFFNLNSLFSDDLGFLLNRYPSMQISVLPYEEAARMKCRLSRITDDEWNKALENGMLSEEYKNFFKPMLPASWRSNHKSEDSVENLDPGAFEIIDEFILELAKYQIPYGEINP